MATNDFSAYDFVAADFFVSVLGTPTGPPYPPAPVGGSNAIGAFTIATSPVGTISAFNYWETVISQYANSPILTQLIANFFQYIDPTQLIDSFYDNMFNINTAQGYGLDVWGRRVGIPTRVINVAGGKNLGFAEALSVPPGQVDTNIDPFNQSPFYSGGGLTSSYALSDTSFRTLIFAKALSNISNGSIPAINQLLQNLFPNRGQCYVIDNLNMSMTYYFTFALTAVEQAILEQTTVLPTPAGVSSTVVFL
jgi:hypothetical protein